jgi:hypothetical protein
MLGAVRAPEAGRARAVERVPGAAPARVVVPAVGAGQARAGWAVGESAAKQSLAFAKCSLVLLVAADLGEARGSGQQLGSETANGSFSPSLKIAIRHTAGRW